MQKIGLFLLCLLLFPMWIKAQLTVNPSNNATTLANQLRGNGLIVNSATLTCPNNAAGTFSNGASTTLGLPAGIVLTTGLASDTKGSASNGFMGLTPKSVANGGGSVPQLDVISGGATQDGCYLDISVIPTCNTLSMRYVFGSEEYPDFVGSTYNDAFGFFVNGPNPQGGNYVDKNIAVIPGTSTAVSINNVNNGVNNTGPCKNCTYYVDNSNSSTITYDGLTKPLTASIDVVPCATYNIRLAIADVGDGDYDSGVFIEANSVSCSVGLVASAAPYTICTGQSTTLTSDVPNGTGTYSWSTGASGNTITVSPTTTTVYTGYYTFCGATVSDTVVVTVSQIAGATFQYTSNAYCTGAANPTPINVANGTTFSASPAGLVFTNTTTGQIDLASSTSGTYTISLPGSGACPAPAQQTITIQNAPSATLSGSGSICSGQTVPLTVSFNGTAPFTFTIDSAGSQHSITTSNNPYTVNAGAVGSYTISNLSDAGCQGTTSGTVSVASNPLPTATFSGGGDYCQGSQPSSIIINLTGTAPFDLSFTENGVPMTQVLNGNNFTYTPSGSTTLAFTGIKDATTCTNTLTQNYAIVENPLPTGTVSGGGSVCFGSTAPSVQFALTGSYPLSVSYSIDGGTAQTVSVSSNSFSLPNQTPGTYTITTITDSKGCVGSATGSAQISFFPGVTASVTSSQIKICPGQVAFVTASGGTTASWSPTPTNSSSSSYNFSSTPTVTTNYTVTVDDGNGCKDTAMIAVIVNPKPTANFTTNAVCFGTPTQFTNSSTITSGSITTNSWAFETSQTSQQQSPQHSYAACGNYQVSLLTISADNCRDSITKSVSVYCVPQANFTIDDTIACVNQSVNFGNSSVAALGSTSSWNFGAGQGTAQNTNASHPYSSAGSYTVQLTITTPDGCSDSRSKNLQVTPSPTADFQASKSCLNTPTLFTNNSSSAPTSPITTYQWTFDTSSPSNTSSLQDPSYTYNSAHNYNAQLVVIDGNNCKDTIKKVVVVTPLPVTNFTNTNSCVGLANTYTSTTQIADSSALTYSWDFQSDHQPDAYTANTSNIYPASGTYNVTLYSVSNNGCKDSIVKQVNVYDYPVVSLTSDTTSGCSPLNVNFTNTSTVNNPSSLATYSWYVSDVLIGTTQNIGHTFQSGTYTVKLVVATNNGCKDSVAYVNYIESYPNPKANFDFQPKDATELNPVVNYTDLSKDNIATWTWNFNDTKGGKYISDSPQHPIYMYADTGTYMATLWVTTDKGCHDSITKPIRIKPEFIIYVPNAFTPNGDYINNTFFPKGIGVNEKEDYTLYVFDRWGNQVFTTNDWKTGWNGKFNNNGKDCEGDIYVYKIYVKDVLGKKHQFTGQIDLIR